MNRARYKEVCYREMQIITEVNFMVVKREKVCQNKTFALARDKRFSLRRSFRIIIKYLK